MASRFRPPQPVRSRGFTLIEILITISLIVLLLALAIPAVSFITGGRSAEGATNQLSAALGRARADAIGLQRVTGLMFFLDPATQNISAAFVQETDRPTGAAGPPPDTDIPAVEVYLDLVADRDFVSLPTGVLPMTIDNGTFDIPSNPTVRTSDGFLGYNQRSAYSTGTFIVSQAYGGVILFDGNGQIVSKSYALRTRRLIPPVPPATGAATPVPTLMGRLLFTGSVTGTPAAPQISGPYGEVVPTGNLNRLTRSQVGVMLLDRAQFNDKNFNRADNTVSPGYDDPQNTAVSPAIGPTEYGSSVTDKSEKAEERYIDENGIALIVNRYNGTLIRAE